MTTAIVTLRRARANDLAAQGLQFRQLERSTMAFPDDSPRTASNDSENGRALKSQLGRVVLVLQGGVALGSYQVGVYEAVREAEIEPDWVIGASISAINASLIAGNPSGQRLARLDEFWRRVERRAWFGWPLGVPRAAAAAANFATLTSGLPAFFAPNAFAFMSPFASLGSDSAGLYSAAPLAATLSPDACWSRARRIEGRVDRSGNPHNFGVAAKLLIEKCDRPAARHPARSVGSMG